jgi:ABC-2 type transport system ATP-binding protein
MDDVEALCERVIMINHGEVMYDGKLKELVNKYITEKFLEITFTEPIKKSDVAPFGTIKEFDKTRIVLSVKKENAKDIAATILKKFPVDDILINQPDVDVVIRKAFAEKKK